MADLSGGPIHTDSRSWFHSNSWCLHRWNCGHNHKATNEPEKFEGHQEGNTDPRNGVDHHDYSRNPTRMINSSIASGLKHATVFLVFALPVVMLIAITKVPRLYNFHSEYWNSKFNHCNFNGVFTPFNDPSISQWDTSGFFWITVAWGKLSFPTAKFIDVVWDIVVGRGVQALLAWITYMVSSRYLSMAMREAPVSYSTYEALAFVPPTLVRTLRLAGDLLTRRGALARLITVWIVLSSLFVISFSSWATAMTGYSGITYAVMNTYDGEIVAWEKYQVVQFTILDAWRIGEPGSVLITTGRDCVADGFLEDQNKGEEEESGKGDGPWEYVPTNCSLFWRTVQYVNKYGLQAEQEISSVFTIDGVQQNLSSPTLNITTSYDDSSLLTLSGYLTDLAAGRHTSRLGYVQDVSPSSSWTYRNQTYPWAYVLEHASCRYSKYHDWGFSFLILFITSLLLALWSIGTYSLWLYVQLHDHTQRGYSEQGTIGIYRSSLDLAQAMRDDFGDDAIQSGMSEWDIRSLVRRRGKAGTTGIRRPNVVSSTRVCEEATPVESPGFQSNAHIMTPRSGISKRAWKGFKSFLSPKPRLLSAENTLPYQSTSSSQAHIMHSSTAGASLAEASSIASITSPSTIFNFSAAIPISEPASLETDATILNPRITSRPGRLSLRVNNSANRSYSYSSTSSPTDTSVSERQTKTSRVNSASAGAVSPQGQLGMSNSSRVRYPPSKDIATNALEFKNDLGDD